MGAEGGAPYSLPVGAMHTPAAPSGYEPPAIYDLGTVADRTLHNPSDFCLFGKQLGGTDGFTFMGISVPISNCSS